jgi:hypothetical protein
MKTIEIAIYKKCARCAKKATYFWIGPDTETEAGFYDGGEFMDYPYLCDAHAFQDLQKDLLKGHDVPTAA